MESTQEGVSGGAEYVAPLRTALRDLVGWFMAEDVRGIVIGGVAASLLGRPRMTRDVDAVVLLNEDRWEKFLAAGAQFGFVPRRLDVIAFARRTRVMLMYHEPSGIDADISFGALPFEEESIDRAISVDVGGLSLSIPTPEDLIIMKAVAHRLRDLADIEAIVETHPKLDLRRVRGWVREFSDVMEMPEIFHDLEILLAKCGEHNR